MMLAPVPQDQDAVAIGALYRQARVSVAESVRCLIEAGHRLAKKKKELREELGHGSWLPWLKANADVLGFDAPQTAQKLMGAANKYRASAAFEDEEALAISREIWGHNVRSMQGGENEWEWFTPREYIELARGVLGSIDLDPATHEQAQRIIRAKQYYTKAENGLVHVWRGRVWLNPPYAAPLISEFVSKTCAEYRAGHVTAAIMLTHNCTDREWFHEAAAVADAICFTRGRIGFENANGTIAAPSQGQAFFYFGKRVARFSARFKSIGFVR